MNLNKRALEKFEQAISILRRCIGEKGVWADPTRYRYQCWTRDFNIAIAPLLHQLGLHGIVRTHLDNLSMLQRPNGQIPILFLDDEKKFVADKKEKSRQQGRESFMLRRYHEGELWNLTPGTKDSEINYLAAMARYAQITNDYSLIDSHRERVEAALAYVRAHIMSEGLVVGCDWRDTMEKELGDKPLLTNNCLSRCAFDSGVLAPIDAEYWSMIRATFRREDGTYIDYPGSERFDPLGGSFAVMADIADIDDYDTLTEQFCAVDSPCGVTIKCRHNPLNQEEREIIDHTDGVVVWPFIAGFTVLALHEMDEKEFAQEQFDKLTALDGFREWYDPATGKGYGAQEQLWSATLYVRAMLALNEGSYIF